VASRKSSLLKKETTPKAGAGELRGKKKKAFGFVGAIAPQEREKIPPTDEPLKG